MSETNGWSLGRRVGFRFVFAYLVLYSLTFLLSHLPGTEWLVGALEEGWTAAALWLGRHVLGVAREISTGPSGSGDTTLGYLRTLCVLLAAVAATGVWSALDRRSAHPRLQDALRVYVRYVLALTLLSYGFAKVFKTQFPFPPPSRLVQPLGQFSPMGLLWTFMGFSAPYTVFAGVLEVVPGLLLLARRTAMLGALLAIGVLANVVVLNFAYDVPVKLYSSHLLLMAMWLAAADARRLLDVFVCNRATAPAPLGWRPASTLHRRALLAAKLAFVGWVLFSEIAQGLEYRRELTATHPLHGLYEVVELVRNGEVEPFALERKERWRWVALGSWDVRINCMDDTALRYLVEYDDAKGTLALEDFFARGKTYELSATPSGDELVLTGTLGADQLTARLRKVDLSHFLLLNRGFHWTAEQPFNR